MRLFLHSIAVALGLACVLLAHMCIVIFLPYPFNRVNIVIIAAVWVFLTRSTGLSVWWAFIIFFVMELFSSTPFGVILASGTFAILLLYWISRSIITNRSWFAAVGLTAAGVIVFRTLFWVFLLGASLFTSTHYIFSSVYIPSVLWEIGLTTSVTTASVLMFRRFIPALDTQHIRLRV